MEALAVGCPVIGYNEGGVGEILKECFPFGLTNRGGIEVIKQKILQLDALGLRPDRVTIFKLSDMLQQTENLYMNLGKVKYNHYKIVGDVVNVICLKYGTRYPSFYVNRLHLGVSKYLKRNHRFYCCTDDSRGLNDGIIPLSFPENPGLKSWPHVLVKLMLMQRNFVASRAYFISRYRFNCYRFTRLFFRLSAWKILHDSELV